MVRPEFWGAGTWKLLYSVVFDNENEDRTDEDIICLLKILEKTLPCDDCRKHYKAYIVSNPPEGNLKIWVNNLHNSINDRLGKPRVNIKIIESQINPPPRVRARQRRVINVQPVTRRIPVVPTGAISSRAKPATPVQLQPKTKPQPKITPTARRVTEPPASKMPTPRLPPHPVPKKRGCGCGKK
jgi:hypothetical protein